MLAAHRLSPHRLILTGVPWLMRRAAATFQQQAPALDITCSAFNIPLEIMTINRVDRLIGELERLQEYATKGDIAPTEVPVSVQQAAEHLREALAVQEGQEDREG